MAKQVTKKARPKMATRAKTQKASAATKRASKTSAKASPATKRASTSGEAMTPSPGLSDEHAQVRVLWLAAGAQASVRDYKAAAQLYGEAIALMPTLGPAYGRRANYLEFLGDPTGEAADRARAKELAAAAKKDPSIQALFDAITAPPPPVEQVDIVEHTIDGDANYFCAEVTADELASAGLAVSGAGTLRVVFGVHTTDDGFEPAAFGEVKRGRSWTLATPRLAGAAAEAFAKQLAAKHPRFERVPNTIDEVLDGFHESAGYADD